MTRDDLSFLADALLALCERDAERPCYSEHGIKVKQRLAAMRDHRYAHCLLPQSADPLLRHECNDVFARASLTDRQANVLLRRLDGWTFEEIGREAGHSKQGAQHIFVQAMKKLTLTFRVYPFKGLSDVYRWETHRGVRRHPSGRIPLNVLR